jgi:hypothetical protein
MDGLHFIGLGHDDREPPEPDDHRRLGARIEEQGFTLCDGTPEPPDDPTNRIEAAQVPDRTASHDRWLNVWRNGVEAVVRLEDDWAVQVIDPFTPVEIDRTWIEQLAPLIGAATEVADTYVGWVSNDDDDDLSFALEDPPFELSEPLAVVYVGQRYLDDNGPPAFAEGAELDLSLPGGRLIVASLEELR